MELFFCEKCGKRLTGMDIDRGDAVRVSGDDVYCRDCYGEVDAKRGRETKATRLVRAQGRSRKRSPATGFVPARRDSARLRRQEGSASDLRRPESSGTARTLLVVLGVAALAGIMIYGLMLMSGGSRPSRSAVVPEGESPPSDVTPQKEPGEAGGGAEAGEAGEGAGGGEGGGSPPGGPGEDDARRLSIREEGAQRMLDDIRRRWEGKELSRFGAYGEIDKLIQRYPETPAAAQAKKLREEIPEPEAGTGMWYVVGGFHYDPDEGIDVAHPPENALDLKATYSVDGGLEATWTLVKAPEQTLRLHPICRRAPAVLYCFCYLHSAAEQEVTLCTNSDDGIKLWLNGTVVVSEDVQRGVNINPDTQTKVKLTAGRNPVLAKITNGGGASAIRLYVKDNEHEVYRTTKGPGAGGG